ncbi:hypothetical protein LOAG_08701 [Loa loa]|uniref:Uncharacterized protein n=1 Tax=Loa loa TaxID=7209 RepID=A0A1S0TUQ9_LOALO|nr:hypothetical protein LOAG_08701 [Loa loa]EFO19788.1 hypothetical protein LOAG_08701 [Loa loa]
MAPVTYSTGQENLKPKIAFWELLSWSKTPPLPNSKIFRQERDSLKTIYMHPRSQHWHITDSVLVCQRTHVMSSAERRTDHPLYDVNSTWALNPNLREGSLQKNKDWFDESNEQEIFICAQIRMSTEDSTRL